MTDSTTQQDGIIQHSQQRPLRFLTGSKTPGKVPLELIEVQNGEYLGEDDIVRIDDHYGRE
jgi:mannose-1-phosphate guanylyltransferase/mannose-6-phosphate isomerase